MADRYFNPFSDFGFKKLFGSEVNKDLLLDFLNSLILDQGKITNLTYLKSERLPESVKMRCAIYDVYCENERGEKFIVEMQKSKQEYFKDRSIFYSTFPIRDQAKRGKEWKYNLKAVYTIGILNFIFDEGKNKKDYMHHKVQLMDVDDKTVFYDKLTYIYLEMPKFNKTEKELITTFDKWLYLLKHMETLERCPAILQEKIFEKAFEIAEIARFTPEERDIYEEELKIERDWYSVISTAEREAEERGMERGIQKGMEKGMEKGIQKGMEKGMEKGREEEKREMACKLKNRGMNANEIADVTGLSIGEIEKL